MLAGTLRRLVWYGGLSERIRMHQEAGSRRCDAVRLRSRRRLLRYGVPVKMRIIVPWFLLALLLVACGGNGGGGGAGEPVCGNGIVEEGEECDEESEACDENCKRVPGWHCPEGEECIRVEICDNGEDDDENGLVDCDDPWCEDDPVCIRECSRQADCRIEGRYVEVCDGGICRDATIKDDEGNVLLGEVGIYNTFDRRRTNPADIRSYSLTYFHPALPGSSERLTCETLAELSRSASLNPAAFNVIRSNSFEFQADQTTVLIRDNHVQATDETGWIVLIRFYTGKRNSQTHEPTGTMLAFSCIEDVKVAPGPWDPARQVSVQVKAGCERQADCPEGWECMQQVGTCYYKCDPPCGAGYVCRQLPNGEPACLRRCDAVPCEPGQICDMTPGWVPACYDL